MKDPNLKPPVLPVESHIAACWRPNVRCPRSPTTSALAS